ncbi:MAG: site-specific DNA-methyltransferase [Candidatus Altiarchaeum hamiconexum]|uniref:Site-specific DNA-methyltransferase n=1 Tax=Candidatus Altarchaeum hamiconexum TaxID=1803513 RepID=A0A8J7YRV7_9ARCH|nr:site-specific DNA-methyltransferase [Candidatus Altarchaeum hamiconexum]OIQ05163.1 MAG: hypothetical protein AUK59_04880 [Candidatus Altarchaeum sp. CG2_30_32_3053]PIN67798.1 MAG: hypothetical protein COV98_01510 [Candidatus Altarchaeum sp. CG12_big_fil_rev_8_21_14_0_65_33_22]PIV28829.1 MAG: hypothetical protein COS36_00890 [Candidatus Altarchaeum sp. CG03_land_8_20_14_0_80_32_618]PIX49210.1 MAG: hypothetical protein COZ53_01330 [Candidatus Altarchaeum sp. CG_4_8_14_3_um_filter_33_2054]PIZ2
MGSGTTAISSVRSGRNFVGYKIDQRYISLTKNRMTPYLTQTKIVFEHKQERSSGILKSQ